MRILNILYLRRYGITAYVHIKGLESIQLRKLAPRAKKGRLVGYKGNNGYIYRVWILAKNKVIWLRDVTFNEALDLLIAIFKDKLTIRELEPELPPETQGLTTTVVTIITYFMVKALEEKEYRKELEGPYISNLILGKLGLGGATL